MSTVKRDQILQEADKLAAKGKVDAAVKEYRRALEQIPNDTNTLNRLGDLLVRANRIPEAIEAFQKVAEHFAGDGFFLKAIAIYKRINRLDPQRTETYERLADLYFKQGLAVEGRQNLLTLADWFVRSRNLNDAVRIYRRLADLEPSNFPARAKLIDLLVQAGDVGGVTREIDSLGRTLLGRGMLDEAIKLYHRALDLHPESTDFLAPCVDSLAKSGRVTQAVELARKGLEAGKCGLELRRAAAAAFAEAGDVDEARALLEAVLPEIGERTDIIQVYGDIIIRSGEAEAAKDLLLPAVDRLIAARDTQRAATLLKRLLRGAPGDVDVLERAAKVFDRREDPDLVFTVEAALADAYFRADRRPEALDLYRRLVLHDPENSMFAQRFQALGGRSAQRIEAPARPVPAPSLPEPKVVEEVEPAEDEVEVEFVDVDFAEAVVEDAPLPEIVPLSGAAPSFDQTGPRPPADSVAELYTEALVFAKYGLVEKAVSHLNRLLGLEPGHEDARVLLASLSPGPTVAAPAPVPAPASHAAPPAPSPAPVWSAAATTPVEASFGGVPAAPPDAQPVPERSGVGTVRIEDLETILGLGDVGRPPSRPVASAAPAPSFDFSLPTPLGGFEAGPSAPLEWSAPAAPEAPAPELQPEVPASDHEEEVEELDQAVEFVDMSGALAGPSPDQLREVDFYIGQGLLDEAARLIARLREAFPDHQDVASRQALLKARGWDEAAPAPSAEPSAAELFSEEEQFFDLARELEQELAEDELVAEARGAQPTGGDVSIEELFKEFQRGVAEQVSEADYDTHFNLGLAYREMGLLDEAIGEFQLSSKFPGLFVESTSMIGACYLDKGLPEQAAEWYQRALTSPDLSADVEWGLRYELGQAYELAGNTATALAQFVELLNLNPGFRDVVERVAHLQRLTN
ncbi:MAG: tetratricopeptide repeat protein [Acidobacteriota bacterium]